MPDPTPKNTTTSVAKPAGWNRPVAEINATIRKAEGGDQAALADVKGMLAAHPGSAEILGGNVAKEALRKMVEKCAGKNPVVCATIDRQLDEMRGELSGASPSALERLLVERVLATWLHLSYLESQYGGRDDLTLAVGGYYQKAISAAQKRYLAAIKGLAEVRKLALPVLQVNIAKKQINVAGTVAAGSGSN